MSKPLHIGIAGLGTVGVGVVKIIRQKANLISARAGRPVIITAVCAQSKTKDRGVDLSAYAWEDDPVALAQRDDVDVFVELMGGADGPAKNATEAAIAAGKDVVTANKAMLAHYGQELALAAETAGKVIRFEAAVAGGIPVVKALTEGLAFLLLLIFFSLNIFLYHSSFHCQFPLSLQHNSFPFYVVSLALFFLLVYLCHSSLLLLLLSLLLLLLLLFYINYFAFGAILILVSFYLLLVSLQGRFK